MTRRGDGAPASQGVAYYGRINHRRAGVLWPVRARTTEGVIRGAPRSQEQQPAGFHGGLPAQLFLVAWRSAQLLTSYDAAMPAMPAVPPRPAPPSRDWVDPFDLRRLSRTPHQAHELAWRRLDARRRGCKLGTAARARRRSVAPRNGRTEEPRVDGISNTVHPLGSSHPSDRGWAVKIRRVATGVFLFRYLFALLGGERLPAMARARPRLFRCSRTHSCPQRALDARCSTASCNRRRDRQDITQAQNLHAWARRRC